MKGSKRNKLKIISAVSVTIFSLFTLTVGVYAWFSSVLSSAKSADIFSVTTVGDCQLADVKLYKFEYPASIIHDGYDYLKPQDGSVKKYNYDHDLEQFGYYDDQHTWHSVSAMNVYDPIELIISSDKSLKDLNCNAVYEITFTSTTFSQCIMRLDALLNTSITTGQYEILLSDCADIDLFFTSDLADNNPLFYDSESGQYNKYYPSYKDNLSNIEKNYYKVSYLSSLIGANSHHNFYSSNPKQSALELYNSNITMNSQGECTIYINVNYAPKRLEQYAKTLYLHNIYALYDFGFEINLSEANS